MALNARQTVAPAQPPQAPAFAAPAARVTLPLIDRLTSGGDERIQLDETSGLNRYGCQAFPDEQIAAFGSSTASVISAPAYAAAERTAARLSEQSGTPGLYRSELDRIRSELAALCGLNDLAGLKTVIAPSGTDLHRIIAQMIGAGATTPPLAITPESAETGSGVGAALGGHGAPGLSLKAHLNAFRPAGALTACQVVTAQVREADGAVRDPAAVDEDVVAVATAAASLGRRVLLVLMDVSKTGLVSPSLDCALDLKRRFPDLVDVFVDACQFRLSPATLKAYLARDFIVAVTGSKFLTGPTFSGALFVPASVAERLSASPLPVALGAFCKRADWPQDWAGADAFEDGDNFGVVLRWDAALEEMRRFQALDGDAVRGFFQRFAQTAHQHLMDDPNLSPLAVRPIDRSALGPAQSWDDVATIHAFTLSVGGRPLDARETAGVHRLAGVDLGGWAKAVGADPQRQAVARMRSQLGQPVACGAKDGASISALRLCASARLAVEALAPGGRGADAVISDALGVLDKTGWLARRLAGKSLPGD